MPKEIRLKQTGFFNLEGLNALDPVNGAPSMLERPAVLVYEGDFDSMDGKVKVTREHLEKLVTNHNSRLSKLRRLASGELPLKAHPPLQVDHSTSALLTVGRVMGDLELSDYQKDDGETVKAVRCLRVRVLGKENVEKVMDGRWCHISIGADLDEGKLTELSITPFPAAEEASLLSSKRLGKEVRYKNATIYVNRYSDGTYEAYVHDSYMKNVRFTGSSESEVVEKCKDEIDSYLYGIGEDHFSKGLSKTTLASVERFINYKGCKIKIVKDAGMYGFEIDDKDDEFIHEYRTGAAQNASFDEAVKEAKHIVDVHVSTRGLSKFSKGEGMNKEKMKKHLMEQKKMSEKEADDHLAKMNDADCDKMTAEMDEHEKKMSKEADEKKEKEEKEKGEKLTAAKAKLTTLSAGFKTNASAFKLQARKGKIQSRLASLKASAKIMPSEIKKIDISKLAAASDEAIEAVLKSYEDREPQVITGQFGSVKAAEASDLKNLKMAQLEKETKANMSLFKNQTKKDDKDQKVSNAERFTAARLAATETVSTQQVDPKVYQQEFEEISKLVDAGKNDEVKKRLKVWMSKNLGGNTEIESQEETMKALAESSQKMQNDFAELETLAASLLN